MNSSGGTPGPRPEPRTPAATGVAPSALAAAARSVTARVCGSFEIMLARALQVCRLFNTEFRIRPAKQIGGIQMLQVLRSCDEAAIQTQALSKRRYTASAIGRFARDHVLH